MRVLAGLLLLKHSGGNPAQEIRFQANALERDTSMSEEADTRHLLEIAGGIQSRWAFEPCELATNRGRDSKAAEVALDRARRLAPAALGRVLCAMPDWLRWADYTQVWTIESVLADHHHDEVAILRLKVAMILLQAMGALEGVYSGDGWGDARTTYTNGAAA